MFLQAYSRIVRPSTSLKFLGLFSTTVLKGRTSSLYLGNLPYSLPEAELSALVQQRIGNNFSQVRVPTDPLSGVNKGFGFIDFDETVELETVCTKLQGLMVEGRAVLCSLADPSMTAVIPGTGEIRDNTSLFVGNIGFLTDPELVKTAITNSLGASAISSIIVHRNENNVNKGYAHIHLHSPELINDALAKLQGIKVDGRALRVDLSRVGETSASYVDAAKHLIKRGNLSKLPAAEVPLGCELFVTNFDINLNEERMYELINKEVGPNSGAIVRFMQDYNGLSKGFCFFRFPTPEAAQAAKDKLNDLEIMGRKLVVEVSTSAPRKAGPSANMVVLSNLPLDFNQELLDEMLGDVIGAGLTVHTNVRMTSAGLCAGVARVEFIDAETANRAVTELNGLEVMERAIYAVSAEKLKESTERRTAVKTTYEVYVSNVEPSTSFFQFKEVIEKHLGSLVVKTRLCMNEETAQCRGYGFIHCSSAEDAERAISELSKITVNGKQLSAQMADDDRNKARGPSAGRGGGGFGGGRGGGGRGGGGRGRGGGGGGRGRGGSQESSYREYHTVPEMDDCMQDLDMTIFKDFL